MQRIVFAAVLAAATAPALAADVGVSVSIGQPGFYGRIDIGSIPAPAIIYPEPVIIQPAPVAVVRQPIYLHVPPGHSKNWAKYCHRYSACGQPVYFVQDRWYQQVYVPRYRARQVDDRGRANRVEYRHEERHERHDDRGHGRGRGDHDRGHGHGRN